MEFFPKFNLIYKMFIKLQTERLDIRPLDAFDAAFILKLLNTPGWLQFIGDKEVHDLVDALSYIKWISEKDGFFYHVVRTQEDYEPIGVVTLLYRDNQEHPDIGFAFLPEFFGKGYAFEAVSAYMNALCAKLPDLILQAIVMPANHRSVRLIEKLGFIFYERFLEAADELDIYRLKGQHR